MLDVVVSSSASASEVVAALAARLAEARFGRWTHAQHR